MRTWPDRARRIYQRMGDPTNAGGTAAETTQPGATQPNPTEPSEEYKGLQRKLSEKDNVIRELAAKVRELEPKPSVEEELARERAARMQLERDVQVERLKGKNPELADVIDALSANGIPDESVINSIKSKIGTSSTSTSSGLRNNPARPVATESEKIDEILKNGSLFS